MSIQVKKLPQDTKTAFVADVVDAEKENTRKLRRDVGKSHCAQKITAIQRKYKQNYERKTC